MKRDDLYHLAAFAVVAEQGSFTRAAAELGMSQSALSHAMKTLEERLGVRLLTTRSVSTTEAGETLLRSLRPALADIASGRMRSALRAENRDNSGSAVRSAAQLTTIPSSGEQAPHVS